MLTAGQCPQKARLPKNYNEDASSTIVTKNSFVFNGPSAGRVMHGAATAAATTTTTPPSLENECAQLPTTPDIRLPSWLVFVLLTCRARVASRSLVVHENGCLSEWIVLACALRDMKNDHFSHIVYIFLVVWKKGSEKTQGKQQQQKNGLEWKKRKATSVDTHTHMRTHNEWMANFSSFALMFSQCIEYSHCAWGAGQQRVTLEKSYTIAEQNCFHFFILALK